MKYGCRFMFAGRLGDSGAKAARPPWWRLTQALSAPYHPELHYMRGPGPKWREKHAPGAKRSER